MKELCRSSRRRGGLLWRTDLSVYEIDRYTHRGPTGQRRYRGKSGRNFLATNGKNMRTGATAYPGNAAVFPARQGDGPRPILEIGVLGGSFIEPTPVKPGLTLSDDVMP